MKIANQKKIKINNIVIFICIFIFILYIMLYNKTGDSSSTMILLGANYKTFTLGYGEYFRLITSGFCHFSFIHLLGNMVSLLSLGNYIETIYGSKKYLLFLICGILIGSLTSGVLNANVFESGISAALYSFLVIIFLYFFVYHNAISGNFLSIVFINLGLNFLPNVSWQAHLGGAISGFIFFYIDYYERTNNNISNILFKLILVITIIFLSLKYYSNKNQILYYKGTDYQYINYLDRYYPELSKHYKNKIYNNE